MLTLMKSLTAVAFSPFINSRFLIFSLLTEVIFSFRMYGSKLYVLFDCNIYLEKTMQIVINNDILKTLI